MELWDVETGLVVAALPGHPGPVRAVAWSPNDTHLATFGTVALALTDGSVAIVPLDRPSGTQQEVRLLGLPDGGFAAFWDDGRRYRLDGDPAGRFWWSSGLCRFEPGELDGVTVERV